MDFIAEKTSSFALPFIGFFQTGIYSFATLLFVARNSSEGCLGNGECFCIHCECLLEEGSPIREGENPSNCCVSKDRFLEISKKCSKLTAMLISSFGFIALGFTTRLNNGGLLVFPIVSAANLVVNGVSNKDLTMWMGAAEGMGALFSAFVGWRKGWDVLVKSAACTVPLAFTLVGYGLARDKNVDPRNLAIKEVLAAGAVNIIGLAIIGSIGGVLFSNGTFKDTAIASLISSTAATTLTAAVIGGGFVCHKVADKISNYVSSLNCCGAIANCSKWVWNKICWR